MHKLYSWRKNPNVQILAHGNDLLIWRHKPGMAEPEGYQIGPDETIESAFARIMQPIAQSETDFRLQEYTGRGRHWPGFLEFWPRIFTGSNPNDSSKEFFLGARQIEILFDEMVRIFRFIEPEGENLDTFGHETRNLLILACTELEAQFRGILKANTYGGNPRTSTIDYIKLLPYMRLSEYEIDFPLYTSLGSLKPFHSWNATGIGPTKTLLWYDAYNATKHDREIAFGRASLRHTIDAISACVIIFVAQYGVQKNPISQVRFITSPDLPVDKIEQQLSIFGNFTPNRVNCPLNP